MLGKKARRCGKKREWKIGENFIGNQEKIETFLNGFFKHNFDCTMRNSVDLNRFHIFWVKLMPTLHHNFFRLP